jgi:hypothetical protein
MSAIKTNRSESGQVLVLVVLAVVVLLGFAALAVDGGMAYSDRRFAQTGADTASLGGGGEAAMILENSNVTDWNWNCSLSAISYASSQAKYVAAARADDNGFVLDAADQDLSDHYGVATTCGTDTSRGWPENYLDVRVELTKDTQTSFAHFIYNGPLRNSVVAITRVRPRINAAFGHAIVALNNEDCYGNQNGVIVNGSLIVNVDGGGIFSNGCLNGSGQSSMVNVVNGVITYVSEFLPRNTTWTTPPNSGPSMPSDALDVPPPDCSQVPYFGSPSNAFRNHAGGPIPPGNYTQINMNGDATLEGGGLYCMYGDFDTGNRDLSIIPNGARNGVTIYLVSGDFLTSGNGNVWLTAPPASPDPFPAIPGLLIYLAHGNHGLVKIRGNSGSYYEGTIYAPDGDIDQAGTSDALAFHSQLIGWNVVLSGDVRLDVYFNNDIEYQIPTRLDLYR